MYVVRFNNGVDIVVVCFKSCTSMPFLFYDVTLTGSTEQDVSGDQTEEGLT